MTAAEPPFDPPRETAGPREQPENAVHGAKSILHINSAASIQRLSAVAKASRRLRPPAGSDLIDKAYDEFCRLRQEGQALEAEDFCARYPAVQSSLFRLIDAHWFLEQNPQLIDEGPDSDFPVAGETIAGFRLERELGRGSFAHVYLAREIALGNRQVVVKVSCHGGAAEAATLGRLSHPNVVPVHSSQEDPASGFTVVCMPYLGSATLNHILDHVGQSAQRPRRASLLLEAASDAACTADRTAAPRLLRRGPFCDGVRWLAAQLADALAFVHGRGVCHRDLKPSNVLVCPDGTPMLLDFNLSADAEQPDIQVGGTLLYMAPEQLLAAAQPPAPPATAAQESAAAQQLEQLHDGKAPIATGPGQLAARADVFALGVVLYELLTGKHPFGPLPLNASAQQLRDDLYKKQEAGVRPIRTLVSDVDAGLAALVQSCLAHDPLDRPTAGELAKALRRGLSGVRRAGRWLVRHPKTTAAVVVLLCASGAFTAYHVATLPPRHLALFTQGQSAYRAGNFDQALALLNDSLSAKPDQPDALWARARTFQKLGKHNGIYYTSAMADWKELDKLGPDPRHLAGEAYCLYLSNPKGGAAACLLFDKARARGFATPVVLNNVAALSLPQLNSFAEGAEQKREQALACLEQALAENPMLATAHHVKATALLYKFNALNQQPLFRDPAKQAELQGLLETAINHVRRALELGPVTADRAFDAAALCAVAARRDSLQWAEPAVAYLKQALDLGYQQKSLAIDPRFSALRKHPGFMEQAQRPQATAPYVRAERVLDPFDD